MYTNGSSKKIRTLVNLPSGFFSTPILKDTFARLGRIAAVQKRSHNTADEIAPDLALPVSVSRRAFSPAVAEMALALTLSTLRQISNYHAAMRRGRETWVRKF